MARRSFGGGLADYTIALGDTVVVGSANGLMAVAISAEVTFWNAEFGGARYTDLLDDVGEPATSIISSDGAGARSLGQIARFQGPDTDVDELWADAGGGRALMIANDASGSGADPAQLAALVARADYTEKGVLMVASDVGVPAPVEVGANGQTLVADSTQAAGVRWGDPAAGFGNVLWWTGTDYVPTELKANTSVPRIWMGPVDPETVDGVVMAPEPWKNAWFGG